MARSLNQEEYLKLMEHLNDPTNWGPETYVTELLLRTGMRQGELVRLTPDDFRFPENGTDYDIDLLCAEVRIRCLKGSLARTARFDMGFGARFQSLVELMKAENVPTLGLLVSGSVKPDDQARQVRRMVSGVLKKVLGKGHGYSAHSLRHTYAKKAFEFLGNDLVRVRLAMGHVSVQSTERYLRHVQADEVAQSMLAAFKS